MESRLETHSTNTSPAPSSLGSSTVRARSITDYCCVGMDWKWSCMLCCVVLLCCVVSSLQIVLRLFSGSEWMPRCVAGCYRHERCRESNPPFPHTTHASNIISTSAFRVIPSEDAEIQDRIELCGRRRTGSFVPDFTRHRGGMWQNRQKIHQPRRRFQQSRTTVPSRPATAEVLWLFHAAWILLLASEYSIPFYVLYNPPKCPRCRECHARSGVALFVLPRNVFQKKRERIHNHTKLSILLSLHRS